MKNLAPSSFSALLAAIGSLVVTERAAIAGATISPVGMTVTAESCLPTNGVIDPAETVSVAFSLHNIGSSDTTNLVATLMATGGVTSPGPPQAYGILTAGGPAATATFSFTASGACGRALTATLRLQDGSNNLGTVSFNSQLGAPVVLFSQNFDPVTAPNLPSGWTATNVVGTASAWKTTSAIYDMPPNSVFSPDPNSSSDNRLTSPSIYIPSVGAQLTFRHRFYAESGFDGGVLEISIGGGPFTDIIVAGGTFITNAYNDTISFGATPVWSGTSGAFIATVVTLPASAEGQNIQLRWRFTSDSNNASQQVGWYVDTISLSGAQCCGATNSADLTLGISAYPEPVLVGSNLTYTILATNRGPANATGVMLTNILPAGVTNVVSITASQGTHTNRSGVISCSLGSLTSNAVASLSIVVVPSVPGLITNSANVFANQPDFNPGNNASSRITTVNLPALSINDVALKDGTNGTTNAVFTVSLASATSKTVTVAYATADGTATAPGDYFSTNGVLSFSPGQTAKTITVVVQSDTLSEADEFFYVNLLNPTNAMLGNAQGVCTLIDDDPLPALSINNVVLNDGSSGTTNAVFAVSLTPASGQYVYVDYQTTNGLAIAGTDYFPTNGTLIFAPGQTSQSLNVAVIGDTINKSNLTFFVNLLNPIGATISHGQGVGTILNDDFLPSIDVVAAVVAAESCAPTNGAVDPNETVTMDFSLKNIGRGTASATNLVATLLATGGVLTPSGPQNYGALTVGGTAVSRPFTFTASGVCGGQLAAIFQLQDGSDNLGTVTNLLLLGRPIIVFAENFDSVPAPTLPADWTASLTGTGDLWQSSTAAADTSPNSAFAPDPPGTSDNQMVSPPIPISTPSAQLSFRQNFATQQSVDGGLLEISINGEPFADILAAGGSFLSRGYNLTINGGTTPAWTGTSGKFITTLVALPASCAGQTIQLAWRFLSDGTVGGAGWYVDTISVVDGITCCGGPPPSLSVAQAGPAVIIAWPTPSTGSRLMFATNLNSPVVWSPVAEPIIITNGQNTVRESPNGSKFFRLVKP